MIETGITLIQLVISVALGAIVGFERQIAGRPAGLRTHMLVCLGACLFTIVVLSSAGSNPAPALAGILTGVGFIGAGCIIAARGQIQGLTTAVSIWATSAIGFSVGAGNYFLAISTAIIVFIILQLRKLESKIK